MPVTLGTIPVYQMQSNDYSGVEQYARHVDDDHACGYVCAGYYVICVDYHAARKSLASGDRVVIQRTMIAENGITLSEMTIRRTVARDGKWFLVHEGRAEDAVPDIEYTGDAPGIKLCDLIIARYALG